MIAGKSKQFQVISCLVGMMHEERGLQTFALKVLRINNTKQVEQTISFPAPKKGDGYFTPPKKGLYIYTCIFVANPGG